MRVQKTLAILVLLGGLVVLSVGIRQVNRSNTANTCVVDFAKSLGGKASFDLRQASQKSRYYGIADISLGIFFVCAGTALLLKLKK